MKKVISILLVIAVMFVFVACGGTEKEPQPSEKPAVKVGLLLEGSLGDESINDQAYDGLKRVAEEFKVDTKYVECQDTTKYPDYIEGLVSEGCNVICCDSFNQEETLRELAPQYPDVNFMILDTEVNDVANVASFTYATHEASYLAGIVAAKKTESNVIAFIGGMKIPTIEKFQVGFEEGVHSVKPDAKVLVKYIGNDSTAWNDPATAKTLTMDCISNGADVAYHAAGASGMGMIEACKEKNMWAIGVNIDQTHLAPENMLTSALTKGDQAIYLFTKSVLDGKPLTGMTVLNCENDGVGIVESKFITDDIKAEVDEATKKIISGEIKVTNVMSY